MIEMFNTGSDAIDDLRELANDLLRACDAPIIPLEERGREEGPDADDEEEDEGYPHEPEPPDDLAEFDPEDTD